MLASYVLLDKSYWLKFSKELESCFVCILPPYEENTWFIVAYVCRYRRLDKLPEERQVHLINHLGFMECPTRDRCYFQEKCAETQVQSLLETASKNIRYVVIPSKDLNIRYVAIPYKD